jgi:hypothetical protein
MSWRLALAIVAGAAAIALASDVVTAPIFVEPTKHPAIPSGVGAQPATRRLDGTWRGEAPLYRRQVTIPANLLGGTRRLRLRFEPTADPIDVSWDDLRLAGHDVFAVTSDRRLDRFRLDAAPPR